MNTTTAVNGTRATNKTAAASEAASSTTKPIVSLQNVSKRFGQVEVLRNINLDIQENSFVSLVGPSGCGKSTLLNLIAGLVKPTSGVVLFRGEPVSGINTRTGYVTQDAKLFPWMTLEENVRYPLKVRRVPVHEREARVREYLEMVGLTGFEKHYAYQLSGGMQKRASIARTLIYSPDVILMDEPFGPLDAQTRMVLQNELLRIWSARKTTILFVTHDLAEAVVLSDYIVVFGRRPATITAVINVDIARPRNVFEAHKMEGFAEVYEQLWQIFRHELVDRTT